MSTLLFTCNFIATMCATFFAIEVAVLCIKLYMRRVLEQQSIETRNIRRQATVDQVSAETSNERQQAARDIPRQVVSVPTIEGLDVIVQRGGGKTSFYTEEQLAKVGSQIPVIIGDKGMMHFDTKDEALDAIRRCRDTQSDEMEQPVNPEAPRDDPDWVAAIEFLEAVHYDNVKAQIAELTDEHNKFIDHQIEEHTSHIARIEDYNKRTRDQLTARRHTFHQILVVKHRRELTSALITLQRHHEHKVENMIADFKLQIRCRESITASEVLSLRAEIDTRKKHLEALKESMTRIDRLSIVTTFDDDVTNLPILTYEGCIVPLTDTTEDEYRNLDSDMHVTPPQTAIMVKPVFDTKNYWDTLIIDPSTC